MDEEQKLLLRKTKSIILFLLLEFLLLVLLRQFLPAFITFFDGFLLLGVLWYYYIKHGKEDYVKELVEKLHGPPLDRHAYEVALFFNELKCQYLGDAKNGL